MTFYKTKLIVITLFINLINYGHLGLNFHREEDKRWSYLPSSKRGPASWIFKVRVLCCQFWRTAKTKPCEAFIGGMLMGGFGHHIPGRGLAVNFRKKCGEKNHGVAVNAVNSGELLFFTVLDYGLSQAE